MSITEEMRELAARLEEQEQTIEYLSAENVDWEDRYRALHRENAKLRELCKWLLEPYRLGAVTGESIDKRWCRETYDRGAYKLRDLGVEV